MTVSRLVEDNICHLLDVWSIPLISPVELRQIEVIVQQRSGIDGLEKGEKDMIAQIQEILYSTAVSNFRDSIQDLTMLMCTLQEGFEVCQ